MNSKTNVNIAYALFFMVSSLEIIGVITANQLLQIIFKPLIVILLILLYAITSQAKNKWYVLALLFSFGGDVFLLFDAQTFFIIGLSLFLLAHLSYITLVYRQIAKPKMNDILLSFIIFFGILLGLLSVLKGHLGQMQTPVIVYGLVLTSFGAVSLINYLQQKNRASSVLLTGALLFVLSDSLLAINKFYKPIDLLNVFVIFTYIAAQFVIFKGVILAEKN